MINNVSINLKTDEVIIKIEDNATQDEIILELTKKLMELKKNVPRRENANSSYWKNFKK